MPSSERDNRGMGDQNQPGTLGSVRREVRLSARGPKIFEAANGLGKKNDQQKSLGKIETNHNEKKIDEFSSGVEGKCSNDSLEESSIEINTSGMCLLGSEKIDRKLEIGGGRSIVMQKNPFDVRELNLTSADRSVGGDNSPSYQVSSSRVSQTAHVGREKRSDGVDFEFQALSEDKEKRISRNRDQDQDQFGSDWDAKSKAQVKVSVMEGSKPRQRNDTIAEEDSSKNDSEGTQDSGSEI